ncbi:(E)-beta-ocimene synthase, chloroplastic-like [Rutidosis leptorrhynchoides]|uniref:(E)-beta-ocimene synthase, chloroplastic-like n=1 Tax=Rutidosis leptorrhynchoides TaxID=125765 RepID=UPI003A990497
MALLQLYQLPIPQSFNFTNKFKQTRLNYPSIIKCALSPVVFIDNSPLVIYRPTIWSHDFIQGLDVNFPINKKNKLNELENKVIMPLNIGYENGNLGILQLLEHIDDIERIGLGYRFQNEIRRALDIIISANGSHVGLEGKEDNLHAASLRFRLLRQHGYTVSQDFLNGFKDIHGNFMECVQTDVKGLLSLYEASFLAFEEERDLHDAKFFSTEHLIKHSTQANEALENIDRALELPLYRRMFRFQAHWYINAYNKKKDANIPLLELATIDFNVVQSTHKREIKELSKWWENKGLARKLSFVRDRIMECFFWGVGMIFEPQYHSCRVEIAKVLSLITVIDDIYDVYGTLDELEIFTDVVKRWDINAKEDMPKYMQVAFLALYDTIIESGSKSSIDRGEDTILVLVKAWGELLEAFLMEAKWTNQEYIPTLEDYMDNAWRSVSGLVMLTHGYFLINHETKKDVGKSLENYHDLMKWSSIIYRLYNDLGTSSDEIARGKTANAISCYMHENGVSEDVAREYINARIDEAWMKLIKVRVDCSQNSEDPFVDMAINLARISLCTYQYGDDHGAPDDRAKERILSVIINHVKIKEIEYA